MLFNSPANLALPGLVHPTTVATISAVGPHPAPALPCPALPSSRPTLAFCSSLRIYVSTFLASFLSVRKIYLCWQSSHVACTEGDNDKATIGSDNTTAEIIIAVVTCCVVGTALNTLCTHLPSEKACNLATSVFLFMMRTPGLREAEYCSRDTSL